MKLLAHRGNLKGPSPRENHPDYLDLALQKYDVELDVRMKNGDLYLGHDVAQYQITTGWLYKRRKKLWVHCKDYESLSHLINTGINVFYHEKENYTVISNGVLWCHDLSKADENSIVPLLSEKDLLILRDMPKIYGVCSDYICQ